MTVAPPTINTLAAFLELAEEKPPLEFADGVVTQKVSPKGPHSKLTMEFSRRVYEYAYPRKAADVFPELRVTFGGASRVPDLSIYRWDRIPRDESGRLSEDFRQPPDVAVEIISPGQSSNSLTRRCIEYVTHGVRIALVIDPVDESVVAYRPGGRVDAWQGADLIDLSDVLADFELTVTELFVSLYEN